MAPPFPCPENPLMQDFDLVEAHCSASIMLGKTAEITHDFEVVEG